MRTVAGISPTLFGVFREGEGRPDAYFDSEELANLWATARDACDVLPFKGENDLANRLLEFLLVFARTHLPESLPADSPYQGGGHWSLS